MRTLDEVLRFAPGGEATLAPGERPEFLEALERVLVSRVRLRSHARILRSRPVPPPTPPVATPPAGAVLAHGLEPLDDLQLVALALDLEALRAIQRVIHRELPPRWFPAMDRDGRLLMTDHGLSTPPPMERPATRPDDAPGPPLVDHLRGGAG